MKLTETLEREYEQVAQNTVQVIQEKETPCFSQIKVAYEKWLSNHEHIEQYFHSKEGLEPIFSKYLQREKYPYTREDIEHFSLELEKYQDKISFTRSGLFLSKLIDEHFRYLKEKEEHSSKNNVDTYTIFTNTLDKKLDYLCVHNPGAHINIIGSVGSHACYKMKNGLVTISESAGDAISICMENGIVTVEGDAGFYAGTRMQGGELYIKGNVLDYLGSGSYAGTIIVNGNAEDNVGYEMSGSTIIIYGNCKDFLALESKGGMIHVFGNVGNNVGYISSGTIINIKKNAGDKAGNYARSTIHIEGNCGSHLGKNMLEGLIIVQGTAGKNVGKDMRAGTIHINGSVPQTAWYIKKGEIFHQGEKIKGFTAFQTIKRIFTKKRK